MKDKMAWAAFFLVNLGLLLFFLSSPPPSPAGDSIEYLGITESLRNHGTIQLTTQDKKNLEKVINPALFQDPQYYIRGRDGNRYPVHFPFYSLLSFPVRIILSILGVSILKTFAITNLFILAITAFFIMKTFLSSAFQRIAFCMALYLSPVAWFIVWPGIDLYIVCFLLFATYFFFGKQYIKAAIFAILASWQSSALAVIALGMILYYMYNTRFSLFYSKKIISLAVSPVTAGKSLSLVLLFSLPYIYNFVVFGSLTPWAILQDGWTKIYGLGIQNINLLKFFEVFFDPNIGLFWYAPVLFVFGTYGIVALAKQDRRILFVLAVLVLTIFSYQTNPAWHHGTSGYGPTRYSLFLLPFLLYFFVYRITFSAKHILLLGMLYMLQLYVFTFNGFLKPNFDNTHYHTPYAEFILNHYPGLYNPTPEIFFDRTNHSDFSYPTTAIYMYNGTCKKAYVLLTDLEKLQKTCGPLPEKYKDQFNNEFKRETNFPRKLQTIEVTLWPDPASCQGKNQYVCMKTANDVAIYTGLNAQELTRLTPIDWAPGAWVLAWGDPVTLTLPPGYTADYYSFKGIYVTY